MNQTGDQAGRATTGGVQSLHRALDLLEVLGAGPLTLGEIAAQSDLPPATIHRLLKTLAQRGYVRQLGDRRYALGFRLVPLGLAANASIGINAQPVLARLVAELGETANLAMLSGDQAEYVAQVPSHHSMRMFTEVGRRVDLHCTGVGKALLAQLPDSQVDAVLRRVGLPSYTEHTVNSVEQLHAALAEIRRRRFAVDEQEQELGVRCVAVPVAVPSTSSMRLAVSVSGPLSRMSDTLVERAAVLLQEGADRLAADIVA